MVFRNGWSSSVMREGCMGRQIVDGGHCIFNAGLEEHTSAKLGG